MLKGLLRVPDLPYSSSRPPFRALVPSLQRTLSTPTCSVVKLLPVSLPGRGEFPSTPVGAPTVWIRISRLGLQTQMAASTIPRSSWNSRSLELPYLVASQHSWVALLMLGLRFTRFHRMPHYSG